MNTNVDKQEIKEYLLTKKNLRSLLRFNFNILHEPTANKNSYRITHAWLTINAIYEIEQCIIPQGISDLWNSIPDKPIIIKVSPIKRRIKFPTLGINYLNIK